MSYDGTPAVRDASLELPDGQVLAVLGPSGCGKSTLLRAVAGLEPLVAGTVAWDGSDLARVPTHKRGFALMFQDGQLFSHLTVARNIGYALRLRRTVRHRRPGSRSCWPWSAWRGTPTGCRPRCPAANGSASRWPAASPYAPGCCCSTNPSPPSTPGCATGWRPTSARSSPTRGSPR